MDIKYSRKFIRQLKQYKEDEELLQYLAKKIKHIRTASAVSEIYELVPIRKTTSHYRIKVKISERIVYRVGIKILRRVIWFASIESDKKRFYKQFP
jgi:hypothetical protein